MIDKSRIQYPPRAVLVLPELVSLLCLNFTYLLSSER